MGALEHQYGLSAIEQPNDAYEQDRVDFVMGMGRACTNLKDVTFDGKWKARILRADDGTVVDLAWLKAIQEHDVFSDRHAEGISLLKDSDTVTDETSPVQSSSKTRFRLNCFTGSD
jgi:hypothetical protein